MCGGGGRSTCKEMGTVTFVQTWKRLFVFHIRLINLEWYAFNFPPFNNG